MPIPERILGQWSHPSAATASIQAHVPIREALTAYQPLREFGYKVFLQGSYKNATTLSKDSDVDVVIRLQSSITPRVTALTSEALQASTTHKDALARWRSFRRMALKAMKAEYGNTVQSGRKSIKIAKGKLHAPADLVVTLQCGDGIAFYLPDERRWLVSYPQQHHNRGVNKEQKTNNEYKRTIRMFKAARREIVNKGKIGKQTAPSYFIECLLYNVPDELFRNSLAWRYQHIVKWLRQADINRFKCQNGKISLFGKQQEQWKIENAHAFLTALQRLWDEWPAAA